MTVLSEQEKLERQRISASVIGTNRMEGLELDVHTQGLFHSYELGELSQVELSAALDRHAASLLAELRKARCEDAAITAVA